MAEKVISVRLDEKDLGDLQEIAQKEGVKRSLVVRRAIKQYIESYNTEKPITNAETNIRLKELEKNFGSLLTRVDILSTQTNKVIERLNRIAHQR